MFDTLTNKLNDGFRGPKVLWKVKTFVAVAPLMEDGF